MDSKISRQRPVLATNDVVSRAPTLTRVVIISTVIVVTTPAHLSFIPKALPSATVAIKLHCDPNKVPTTSSIVLEPHNTRD